MIGLNHDWATRVEYLADAMLLASGYGHASAPAQSPGLSNDL